MRKNLSILMVASLLAATTAHAASDTGLMLHNSGGAGAMRSSGVSVQAGVTVQFGDRKAVKLSDRVRIGIAAGPVIQLANPRTGSPDQRPVANIARFELRPGYSTSFSLAGRNIATAYTRAGAAEASDDDADNKPKKKQSTGTKFAWVAAVAGGVMVALVGAAAIAFASGCYECDD